MVHRRHLRQRRVVLEGPSAIAGIGPDRDSRAPTKHPRAIEVAHEIVDPAVQDHALQLLRRNRRRDSHQLGVLRAGDDRRDLAADLRPGGIPRQHDVVRVDMQPLGVLLQEGKGVVYLMQRGRVHLRRPKRVGDADNGIPLRCEHHEIGCPFILAPGHPRATVRPDHRR